MSGQTTRYKLTIEYDGAPYAGWQRQEQTNVQTIQGEIEKAVHAFSSQSVTVQCAGRTDAGVHAWAQIAHMDLDPLNKDMSPYEITKAINAHLRPQPISIIHTEIAPDGFHARFDAQNKLYVYRIINRLSPPVLEAGRAWHIKRPLNAPAMHKAAQILIGKHDFTSFRDSECQAAGSVRTLDRLTVFTHQYDPHVGVEIRIEAEAQSFLHHMVRNLVGTLTLVGEGKWNVKDVQSALEACDRTKAGQTAPAEGLFLKRVDYPPQ